LTGTCYNFEMEEFFSSFLRRAGMPASAGLSCYHLYIITVLTCSFRYLAVIVIAISLKTVNRH